MGKSLINKGKGKQIIWDEGMGKLSGIKEWVNN